MSNYSVSSSPALDNFITGIYGQVNSTYIFIVVYTSALNQAYASSGQAGIQAYLSPLMLNASQAFYQQAGMNPTVHNSTAFPSRAGSYPNMPASWSA